MSKTFDITRFQNPTISSDQYDRQIDRLLKEGKEVKSIEEAVRGAVVNLDNSGRSFVIYGEPQSGKTEMMICLTAKLIDMGRKLIVHLLNDSVDLLSQNLGRFKESGLAPSARNYTEILDPAVKISGNKFVIFCKKNGSDLRKLIEKLDNIDDVTVIDDEADYASPNSKINTGQKTPINSLIEEIIGKRGVYIGVTATPARLNLNNTFDNDSSIWVNFPPHSKYTGQDHFFPISGSVKYIRSLLPDAGSDPKYARKALFGFLVNAAYLNKKLNTTEQCYSFLVHTSGKKVDHKSDWGVIHSALDHLVSRQGSKFAKYTENIWTLSKTRYPDEDPDAITEYILNNITRNEIVVLNSERDWKNKAHSATNPSSLFTIIIGGNIVSRGVTLNNLISMFFTRDVKHKIQQDTYIQRARMFGSRGSYLKFFELTIPESLYVDWHRCFIFHRLALSAIQEGLGSLVWLGDQRISPVATSSIDKSTVDLDRGEMSFSLFDFSSEIENIASSGITQLLKIERLRELLGEPALPEYLDRFIRTTSQKDSSVFVHKPLDISGYRSEDTDVENVLRKRGFIGNPQLAKAPKGTSHHVFICHNSFRKARIVYKFVGSIQFIKNLK